MDDIRVIDVPEHTALGDGDLGVPLVILLPRISVAGAQDRFEDVDDLEVLWDYLVERVGNGITTFSHGFTVREAAGVTPLVLAKTAESVAAPCGPMGTPIGARIGELS